MSPTMKISVVFIVAHLAFCAEADIAADVEEEFPVRGQQNGRDLQVEPQLWEQFVRHQNPAKAKQKFENDLTDGLFLEILIAFIGFTATVGIRSILRLKRGKHQPAIPRVNKTKAATSGRSATSVCRGVVGDSRRLVRHPADDDNVGFVAPSAQPGRIHDAKNNVEKRSNQVNTGTDADEIKKISKAISSGRVINLASFLEDSLMNIEQSSLPLAEPKAMTEALMVLLRSCTMSRSFKEAIVIFDRFENRIGVGSRQLWSLLLYIGSEGASDSHCTTFFAKLCAEAGDTGPSGRDLVNVVRVHARRNDLTGLQASLDSLKGLASYEQYDRLVRNRALAACYKAGSAELAECIAKSPIFSVPLDIVGLNTLITCYSRIGKFQKCFATFDAMEANGTVPTQATFGSLMEACVGAQDWDRAKAYMRHSAFLMNAQHCTILIKGLVKQKRLEEAEQFLKDISFAADVRLDVVTFYTLLRAYSDEGDCDGAERVYSAMIHHGIRPDEYVCNALIHSCTVTKMKSEYVNDILERSSSAGVKASPTTLSLMLKAFALSQDFGAGVQLLRSCTEKFGLSTVEPRLFVQFAQAAIKVGEKAKALEIHEAMGKALSANGQDSYKAASRWLLRQCERM